MNNKKLRESRNLIHEMMRDTKCGLSLIGESVKKFDDFIDETKISDIKFLPEDQEFLDLLHKIQSIDIDEVISTLCRIGFRIEAKLNSNN